MMLDILVRSVGIVAPGLTDWPSTAAILRGEVRYRPERLPRLAPMLLPPNERRRATPPTRLAMEAARQATEAAGADPRTLPSVFASSDGDLDLIDRLCLGIAQHPVALSPTLFHNSVHNAVAGYWSIGSGCMEPSTSLAAGDATFAAGLLECATQLATDCERILLVAYDLPGPPSLDAHRHFAHPFACALLLARDQSQHALARIALNASPPTDPAPSGSGEKTADALPPELEAMRSGNPAARVLPLLLAMARGHAGTVELPYLDGGTLNVDLGFEPHAE
ncbi:beta-ketoacyl synthase chain length factor [Imhoffiella purpurea]|uniref:3-oxoacyl-[ACP] synthase n=1 Tax=Imhoffiella purpurea TaxID=1249627 RepID=W9V9U8_9GAMM|nr:beta-ketoacyl synthase chain length factor [Imhoffiella purpurea]EXJ16229.1 3-oxoacyl-[ACP] synthase [Imhoffiella purpurea]